MQSFWPAIMILPSLFLRSIEYDTKAWWCSVWRDLLKVMWKMHMEETEATWQLFPLRKQLWRKEHQWKEGNAI